MEKLDFNWRSEPATFENLKNVFVVIHPADNNNPVSNSGSYAHETEIKESTLVDAIALADSLQDKFSESYIVKLTEHEPEHRGLSVYVGEDILAVTEKGGVDDGAIVWEKVGNNLPRLAATTTNKTYGKVKLMKIEKYLKYDDNFFPKIESGFFK